MEQNGPWATQGISGEAGIVDLLFDPFSKLVVAHVGKKVSDDRPLKSLYAKLPEEERYHPLTPVSDRLSYEDAMLSPCGPFLFLNIFEAIVEDGKFDRGFDWHSLQKIELPSGKIMLELKWGDLEPRVRNFYSPWIAGIAGIANDGETLYVRLATPRENENKLRYCLAKLYPAQKRYEVITELSGTFL